MSGAATAAYIGAAVAAVGTAVAYDQGQDQKKAAGRAADQAEKQAQQQAKSADQQLNQAQQDTNRANQRQANTGSILDAATQAGKGGASGTMLTGAGGVDPNALNLGKNTLLGG